MQPFAQSSQSSRATQQGNTQSSTQDIAPKKSQVRGRFAPSPSGPLHFGSLVAALGSYLHAKANDGLWFVRIEDIDTTRVVADAEKQIFEALTAFGFDWDLPETTSHIVAGKCVKQTERLDRYQTVFNYLIEQGLVYGCQCTRKQIKAMGGSYDRTCLDKSLDITNNPVRLKQTNPVYQFEDGIFGTQHCPVDMAEEDYIIKRRDGLFSYQLVVVVDDIDQGITHVVRGADIMPLTARQIALYEVFDVEPPQYIHLPLAVTEPGKKLSKQNHAQALNTANPIPELTRALSFLGFDIDVLMKDLPDQNKPTAKQILEKAITHAKTLWSSPSSMKSAIGQDQEITI